MKQQGLAYFTQLDLSIFAMLIFVCWFVIMIIWVFKINSKKQYDSLAQLPLNDEVTNV